MGSFELYFFLEQVKNLDTSIGSNNKDILNVIPGPDVSLAINNHEDIEEHNTESEMIEITMNAEERCNNW